MVRRVARLLLHVATRLLVPVVVSCEVVSRGFQASGICCGVLLAVQCVCCDVVARLLVPVAVCCESGRCGVCTFWRPCAESCMRGSFLLNSSVGTMLVRLLGYDVPSLLGLSHLVVLVAVVKFTEVGFKKFQMKTGPFPQKCKVCLIQESQFNTSSLPKI